MRIGRQQQPRSEFVDKLTNQRLQGFTQGLDKVIFRPFDDSDTDETDDAASSSSSDASDRTQIKCQPMKLQHSDDVMEVACVDVIISNVSDDNEVSMN